ncbi:hypothetical protein CHS0354_002583 [Potamilus streckersoni]|uniref:THD domain-containing protein n=1 Tax=Potamilus streckersoni TaxID=2493646 RepID=A0AAE0RNV0_9BIVA|nr:hypothetical protein CHS0354_002583 [Potamilus streckersoni]
MEHCQSETSVKVPMSCKSSTSNLIEPMPFPSSLMRDHTGNHTLGYENYRNLNFSSEWNSEKLSDSCMSSSTDFPEPPIPSPSPEIGIRPIFIRQDCIQLKCDKSNSGELTSTRSPERSYINRRSIMILGFLVIISCIGSAIACSFLKQLIDRCNDLETKLNNAQSTYTQRLHDAQEFCLPCVELIQGPFEEDNLPLRNLTRKTVDGIVTCCGRTPSQLSIILDLYIGQKQKEKCAREILNLTSSPCANITSGRPIGTQISAHLLVGLQEDSSIGQGYQPLRNWRHDNETTHISGMELLNDRLNIPESGLYFVYSQVGFEIHYNSNEDIINEKQTLYHHLSRYNPVYPNGGSQTIGKGAATQCWEKFKDFGVYTSYTGATVKLNKGDQLYIIVSQVHISKDPKLTYFGAYKIY